LPQGRRSVPEVPKGQETFPGLPEPHQEGLAALREEAIATSTAPASTAPASTAPASTAPASTAPASTAPASTAPASTAPAGELRKVAVYLEEGQDAALDALHYAGASRRPRLDVSKSAVVRLAMERLLSELSYEEVVEVIAARPITGQTSGRKRR